jgi:hypothetical protein
MPTYDAIATNTLSSAVSTVTFSSISQSYTDLFVVYKIKMASGGATNTFLRFNGDTAANYSGNGAYYTIGGSRGYHSNGTTATGIWLDNVDSTWTTVTQIDINNYKSTNMKKTILVQSAAPASQVDLKGGGWNSTAAINSITIYNTGVNFAIGSQFTIYGILAA